MEIEIDTRKKRILQTVVQKYILTGRPVGSKSVDDSCQLGVSTATIRNELALLEKLGFLQQPYTSAGRVPTDIAYRYYVDMLMGHPKPSGRDSEAVERLFAARTLELEGFLQEASCLLSSLTHATALVFAPFTHADRVRHIDLIRLASKCVMVIVITSHGQVGRRLINLMQVTNSGVVERVSKYLELTVSGKGLEEIDSKSIIAQSRFELTGLNLLQAVIDFLREYLGTIEERVFIGGTANIVREMEGAGPEWVQILLEAMEKQYIILDLLKELIRENQLTVRIGEENRLRELQKCAFVGTSYPIGQGILGSLGVVGPTRMDYARTIGMVEYVAKNLGRILLRPLE